jgi:L-lactate utilization protein LutB
MLRYRYVVMIGAALATLNLTALRGLAEEHPRLHAALYELRHARTELKEAKHDFGGHRAKALEALNAAITQIDQALKAVGDNRKSVDPGADIYKSYVNHPHIRHALVESRKARTELKEAAHDYKGHRAKAVAALDEVIGQLEKALKYAR